MKATTRAARFGVFEFEFDSGTLSRDGVRIRLQDQPRQVLRLLVERQGELVTREELRQTLWPDDTFVDFDTGLNVVINKLRLALDDSAASPRFIETFPRRGYRFLAPVIIVGERPSEAHPAAIVPPGPTLPRDKSGKWLGVALVMLAITAIVALGGSAWRKLQTETPEEARLSIITTGRTLNPFAIAISPDGRLVAYVAAARDGATRLFVRPLNSEHARELAGTEDAAQPFFSPDGRSIGFFVRTSLKLMRVDVSGGAPMPVTDLVQVNIAGGAWNSEGTIVFSDSERFRRVPAAGGPASIVGNGQRFSGWRWPHLLPDGHHFLYADMDGEGSKAVYVGSIDSDERKLIMSSESMAVYAPPGVLLFVRGGTLVAQPFDLNRLELAGNQIALAERILTNPAGNAAFAVSDNGTLIYRAGQRFRWQWLNRTTREATPMEASLDAPVFRLAPDEKHVVFTRVDRENEDIWIYELDTGVQRRLTNDPAMDHEPIWSPDSSRLAFDSSRPAGKHHDLYEKRADATSVEQVFLQAEDGFGYGLHDWSLDDRYILSSKMPLPRPNSPQELWVLPRFGDRKPFRFKSAPFNGNAAISPDGRWIAYTSDNTGKRQIVVQSFPDAARAQRQITRDGGQFPRWKRDGRELYYANDGKIFAVPVTLTATTCEIGTARDLFGTVLLTGGTPAEYQRGPGYPYDVTADGQRFLVSSFPQSDANGSITVVQNWTAALKRSQ